MRWKLIGLLFVLCSAIVAVGGYVYYWQEEAPPRYLSARVERGRLAATINATGTVNAVVTVQVGSQVTGTIQQLMADFNAPVQEGQVIAQIDPAPFAARVSQAQANLANAMAAVQVAEATIENTKAAIETAQANTKSARANIDKAKVTLADARRTLERQQGLVKRSVAAQSALDTAQAAADEAAAQLTLVEAQYEAALGQLKAARAQEHLAEAQHVAARAQVEQAKAVLQAAQLDLAHTTIRSPVTGIVVSRNVDVGQTVAASLQAPTLFLIAQDLTRMQVNTNVSEADIGKLAEGQGVTFTVDAYPETTFRGKVVQVRNAPITVQNVVTYDAVVEVANPELKLKPGMTANVVFIIAERRDVLKVPNAALRFQPGALGQGTEAQGSSGAGRGNRLQALKQRLIPMLSLTHEQQIQLDGILEQTRQQGMRLREQELSEAERRDSWRELQRQTRTRIRQILNDAQRQQYDAWIKTTDQRRRNASATSRRGRVWIQQPNGTLESVPVRLGIADETHTELLKGNLHEGQEVVTGLLLTPKRSTSTPPGFGRRAF